MSRTSLNWCVVSLLCLASVPGTFASSLFLSCSTVTFEAGFGTVTVACPAGALPTGAVVTEVKVYDISSFTDGFPGVRDEVYVTFFPSFDTTQEWSPPGVACFVDNASGGTSPATNTCNFYSGTLTEPETFSHSASGTLDTLAASGFNVGVSADSLFGAVGSSSASNIVEYDYTVNGAVPEPASECLLGGAFLVLGILRWRVTSHPGRRFGVGAERPRG